MPSKRKTAADPDMLPEYDFSKGERGRFYKRFQNAQLKDTILLDPALRRTFPDSASVNEALRTLVRIAAAKPESTRTGAPRRRKAG
jgi:hypothetical protein